MVFRKRHTKKGKKSNALTIGQVSKDRKHGRFGSTNAYRVKSEPFPRVLFTRMKFAQTLNVTTDALGIAGSHTYQLNSIYDPDYHAGGNSCVGWSNLNNLYGRYIVTNAEVIVKFFDPDTSNGAVKVGCAIRINQNNPTAGKTMDNLSSQPLVYMKGLSDRGTQKSNFHFNIKPWTLLGVSKLEYFANTSKYSTGMAIVHAVPNCALFDVFWLSTRLKASELTYTIRIIMSAQIYERKTLAFTV